VHPLSGLLDTGEGPEGGSGGDCDCALHPTERLERVDNRGAAPGRPLVCAFLCQTRPPCGVGSNRAEVFWAHDLLRWGGTDALAEPAEGGWSPGRAARVTAIVPQEQGLEPKRRGLESVESLFTRPAQGSHGVILYRGDIDRREVP
jgi:hypothetical protein